MHSTANSSRISTIIPLLSHAPPRLPSVQKPDFAFLMGFTLAGKTIHPQETSHMAIYSRGCQRSSTSSLKLTGEEVVKCLGERLDRCLANAARSITPPPS